MNKTHASHLRLLNQYPGKERSEFFSLVAGVKNLPAGIRVSQMVSNSAHGGTDGGRRQIFFIRRVHLQMEFSSKTRLHKNKLLALNPVKSNGILVMLSQKRLRTLALESS